MLDLPENGHSPSHNGFHTVRFGEFEADLRVGEIRKAGSRIRLQDQPFKILQILLEKPGNVVSREELQSRIWPEDNYGDFDHAVNVAIGKLRTALGDSAENPAFIETVPRRGYRFVATVDAPPALHLPAAYPPVADADGAAESRRRSRARRVMLLALTILACAALLGTGIWLGRRSVRSRPAEVQRHGKSRDRLFRPLRARRTQRDLCGIVGGRAGRDLFHRCEFSRLSVVELNSG